MSYAETPRGEAPRGSILVVDDESYVRDSLASVLERRGFDVRTAASVDEALTPERLEAIDAVVTDLKMPGRGGLELVCELQGEGAPPVIVLTAYGTIASAVTCLQAGAAEYLLKPTNADELVLSLDRWLGRAKRDRERRYLRAAATGPEGPEPLGGSRAWRRVLELAGVAAGAEAPVLLSGETGTGKEEVARLIHRRSRRRDRAFVAVNCAAIPVDLFESELFGHRRGAFTGALDDREGRFRVADGGTLLLDEINSLPATAQAKLLRVLEDGAFERLGDSRPTRVDVRLICASNARLEDEVAGGRFRADLFYRVNVVTIELPPLRERLDDVELLADHFLAQASAAQGKRVVEVAPRTLEVLCGHAWPGNVRELKNVIERGVLLETGETLRPESLPPLSGISPSSTSEDLELAAVKARAERGALLEALRRSGGVRKDAAALLGVDERNLAYYLRKHGLMRKDDD
ncbi:MAG: sigma-54-dependent Fis family transcriptional regulator [Acidobacteria bacterium]|nr:sigma-54-dependent Fis family transcriptional regulator [Acidobacteriota bacterium]